MLIVAQLPGLQLKPQPGDRKGAELKKEGGARARWSLGECCVCFHSTESFRPSGTPQKKIQECFLGVFVWFSGRTLGV